MGWRDLAPPGVTAPLGFGAIALGWAIAFVGAWVLANLLLKRRAGGGELHGVAVGTWALKVAMLLHHLIAAPLALVAIGSDPVTLQAITCFGCSEVAPLLVRDEVQGPSYAAQALVPITIGYMLADLVLIGQWSLPAKGGQVENVLMLVHHTLSMITWPHCVWFNFCTRYVLFLVSYELSSIFLTVNWLLSTAGMKQHPVYFVSGLLFTATFVVTRMLGALPQLLALWHAPPWVAPTEGVPTYVWRGSIVLLLPHVMNFFWGVKVIRGFAAVAFGSRARGKGASAKDGVASSSASCDDSSGPEEPSVGGAHEEPLLPAQKPSGLQQR